MKLQNKYVVGCLVQFYEIEMLPEYIESCVQMLKDVDNPDSVTFYFCISMQEYFEKISVPYDKLKNDLIKTAQSLAFKSTIKYLKEIDEDGNEIFDLYCPIVLIDFKKETDQFYNIARFRRDLCYNWCEQVDYILWGETDSLFPRQTLEIIEGLHHQVKDVSPKFLMTFAYRRNWDSSWDKLVHPAFESIPFVDNDDFVLHNEASEKAYMSLERMNEINDIPIDQVEIVTFAEPKADGSCLVISSDLIKSGVNIPHGIIHNAEDISLCQQAKRVLGDQFVQYHCRNILRVHNRRHPRKRVGILNENNPAGFCDDRKGDWWKILENASNENYRSLWQQKPFIKTEDVIKQIQGQ